MLAGIIGDVIGSVYEAHQWKAKNLALIQPLPISNNILVKPIFKKLGWVRKQYGWTDDTLCTLALYAAYRSTLDPTKTLQDFCLRYGSEEIGFGSAFSKWIIDPIPYESYGNGSIMRIGFIPWLNMPLAEKLSLANKYTEISHNHVDSYSAVAGFIILSELLKQEKLKGSFDKACLKMYLNKYEWTKTVEDMHVENIFELNAQQTLLQAVTIVLESSSMEEVLRNSFYVGGDSDTLACIAANLASVLYKTPDDLWKYALNTFADYPELKILINDFQRETENQYNN